ncbi:MAG: hypothetical protein ABWZ76_10070 [Acidimicrobiales bacterium]
MEIGGTRGRHIASLLAALLTAFAVVLFLPTWAVPGEAQDGQAQETTTTATPVETSTTTEPSTTTVVRTTTTVRRTTTTTRATTTTQRQTPRTTGEVVATTAAPTTLAVTTSVDLLVPGDGTEGAESTTTTSLMATTISADDGPSDGTLIAAVIAGLVLVAVTVGVLTWRYWAATRPPLQKPDPSATSGARPAG